MCAGYSTVSVYFAVSTPRWEGGVDWYMGLTEIVRLSVWSEVLSHGKGWCELGGGLEPDFSQYVSALMVEVMRMFEYFTGFPDEAGLLTVTLPTSSGWLWKYPDIATSSTVKTNVNSCSTSFPPFLKHMGPSHQMSPHSTPPFLAPTVKPIYIYISIHFHVLPHIILEDGDWSIHWNAGTARTHSATEPQKLMLHVRYSHAN